MMVSLIIRINEPIFSAKQLTYFCATLLLATEKTISVLSDTKETRKDFFAMRKRREIFYQLA